jgi:hypothetical protein
VNFALLGVILVVLGAVVAGKGGMPLFYTLVGLAFVAGVSLVLPIGGADMPVVVALLNSYSGLASAATGFAISNNVLLVSGALDGASGFLLSMLMSKAMNRSFANVLFEPSDRRRRPWRSLAGRTSLPRRSPLRTLRCSSPTPVTSSWCQGTAWPSRRPSIRSASSPS